MAVVLGVAIGTTTITSLAVDAASGEVLTVRSISNDAEITSASHKATRKRFQEALIRVNHELRPSFN